MRKVTLFIAISLDGYIADEQGRVDWLQGEEADKDDMVSYYDFIKDIDSVVMGWTTYHQLVSEICPEKWIYEDLHSYVITTKQKESTDKITFVQQSPKQLIEDLLQKEGKGIRLFENIESNKKLTLTATKHYNGIVDLVYEKRK